MKSLVQRLLVSSAIAFVSLAPIGHAMAQTAAPGQAVYPIGHATAQTAAPGQAIYKDLIRPNGQMRSDAVHQTDVSACYAQTGASPYLPDTAAMKKCMRSRGYQFVSQRGFGSSSGRTVASGSGSSDDDWVQQTLQNNHQAEQQQEEQNTWALQQQTIQDEQQSADETVQETNDIAASIAADAAQNALAQDMINQDTMQQLNNQ